MTIRGSGGSSSAGVTSHGGLPLQPPPRPATERSRLTDLLYKLADECSTGDGEIATMTLARETLANSLGDWLLNMSVEVNSPVPRAVVDSVRADADRGPLSRRRVHFPDESTSEEEEEGTVPPPPPPRRNPATVSEPKAAPATPTPPPQPAAEAPDVPQATNLPFQGLPRRSTSTANGTGRYYLVLCTARHIPSEYAGLYNRYADYQRVVAMRGTPIRPRSMTFCPDSESMRVDSVAEAERRWADAGFTADLTMRFRT